MRRHHPFRTPHSTADLPVEEAARRRDRGRTRVRVTTGWAVAAAVVGTAALGAGYASAIPGGSATHPSPAQPPAGRPSGSATTAPGTGRAPASTSPGPAHVPTTAPGGSTSPAAPARPSPTSKPAKPSAPAHRPAKPAKPSTGLQAPTHPPAPTTQPPQTTTGGS